jgi:hypothetical protein
MDTNRRTPETVRTRCTRLLADLGIDRRAAGEVRILDIQRRVERLRGRPLRLVGVVVPAGCPSGMWWDTDSEDVVVFDTMTSPLHQLHILLHEVAHMLLGHVGSVRLLDAATMFRDLRLGPVTPVMLRSGYDDRDEHEAEVFATMACERLGETAVPPGAPAQPAHPELVNRLLAALADQPAPGGRPERR